MNTSREQQKQEGEKMTMKNEALTLIKEINKYFKLSLSADISEEESDKADEMFCEKAEMLAEIIIKVTGGLIDNCTALRMAKYKTDEIKNLFNNAA
jgi:hypothetical protein